MVPREPAETGGAYYRLLPEGATLETGKAREELGQLEGRAYKGSAAIHEVDTTEDPA